MIKAAVIGAGSVIFTCQLTRDNGWSVALHGDDLAEAVRPPQSATTDTAQSAKKGTPD